MTNTQNDPAITCEHGVELADLSAEAVAHRYHHREGLWAPRPIPDPLNGCNCGGIGGTGSHFRGCPWGRSR